MVGYVRSLDRCQGLGRRRWSRACHVSGRRVEGKRHWTSRMFCKWRKGICEVKYLTREGEVAGGGKVWSQRGGAKSRNGRHRPSARQRDMWDSCWWESCSSRGSPSGRWFERAVRVGDMALWAARSTPTTGGLHACPSQSLWSLHLRVQRTIVRCQFGR